MLAVVADYAAVDASGKLNLIGGFTDVLSQTLPAVVSQASIVALLEAPPTESGQLKNITITLMGPGERSKAFFEHEFSQETTASLNGEPVKMNVIIHIQNLTLEEWGDYQIRFTIDGHHKRSIPLRLRKGDNPEEQH